MDSKTVPFISQIKILESLIDDIQNIAKEKKDIKLDEQIFLLSEVFKKIKTNTLTNDTILVGLNEQRYSLLKVYKNELEESEFIIRNDCDRQQYLEYMNKTQ